MSRIDKARTAADIVKIGYEIYGSWRDRKQREEDKGKDERIRELEAQIEKLRQERA